MDKAGGNQLCTFVNGCYEYVMTKLAIASFGSMFGEILSIAFSTKLAAASFVLMEAY